MSDGARTTNLSGREFCRYCLNDGYVVVGLAPATTSLVGNGAGAHNEELGPCPFCEQGVRVEFQEGMPWGPDGFWRGRSDKFEPQPLSTFEGWKAPPPDMARGLIEQFGRAIGAILDPVSADGADAQPSAPTTPTATPATATETSSASTGFGTVPE